MNKYGKAVENIIQNCLRVKPTDKVVVVTDRERLDIGEAIVAGAAKAAPSRLFVIEDYTKRPAKFLPKKLASELKGFKPTVSIYAATGKIGELEVFRQPLRKLLVDQLRCRHAHMIAISEQIMLDGMSKDYKKVQAVVAPLYKKLLRAKKISVVCPYGTNLSVTFSKKLKWVPEDGSITKQGDWRNLPAGEIFTCPERLDGKVVVWILGDYLSEKYGLLKSPVAITIEGSFVTKVESKNKAIEKDLKAYLGKYKNGNRAGEFSIGCLLGLKKLIGNLLQDEKFPGVHMAFGHPYPELTGQKSWDSPTHIDVIPLKVTVKVDGKLILKNGKFV